MRRGLIGFVIFLAINFSDAMGVAYGQEEKPLAPGWLSLDSSVGVLDKKIDDGKSVLEKALGINIDGYLDTSYTWSSNHPRNPPNISGRYFDKDYNDIVFNDFNITIDKPEKDWGVGFHIAGDFGRTGELLREATLWGETFHHEPSAELRESYLTTTLPIGAGLQVKGGLFVTTLGTEIIPNPGAYNDNISRSFLFNYAIPFRHLGTLFTYPVHRMVSLSFGVVTGWDDPHDNNHQPSFLYGASISPNDKISLASNIIYGAEQKNGAPKRLTWSNVFTLKPLDPLALYIEYTYGHEGQASLGGTRAATWQGLAGIASYSWTDRFTTAFRGEFFNDRDGARLGGDFFGKHANVTLGEITFTGSYKLTKMLLGRVEFRQDWSSEPFFKTGATGAETNQTTLAVQLLYTF